MRKVIIDPRCRKCHNKVFFDPVYPSDKEVSASCVACGDNWELETTSTGNAGVLARFMVRSMVAVSNGNS